MRCEDVRWEDSNWLVVKRVGERNSWHKQLVEQSFCLLRGHDLRESGSVQSLSCVWLFVTPWITACQTSLSITNSRSSLRLTSIESVMPSSHLILGHPLLLLPQSLPSSGSFPMSQLFTWGGQSIGVSPLASVLPKNTQDIRQVNSLPLSHTEAPCISSFSPVPVPYVFQNFCTK